MMQSMTAFASGQGAGKNFSWQWELRSVNGKGLDLRLRVPDWVTGLETALRSRLSGALGRGNVTLSLRLNREETETTLRINHGQLATVLQALAEIEQAAAAQGLALAPTKAGDLLSQRGVMEQAVQETDTEALLAALLSDFTPLLADFLAMRRSEGAALAKILQGQLAQIASLVTGAKEAALARAPRQQEALKAAMARLDVPEVDPARLAQELALLAVKTDITEELDRLGAHVEAARALLAGDGAAGRKLDFLMQEFNREANTLCSKAQDSALTAIGLELKTVIDQMREQVQNLE